MEDKERQEQVIAQAKEAFISDDEETVSIDPFAHLDTEPGDDDDEPETTAYDFIDGVDEEDDVDPDESSGDDDKEVVDEVSDDPDKKVETIGQDLLFRAAQAGLSYEDTQAFGTPQALEAAIKLKNPGKSTDGPGVVEKSEDDALAALGDFEEVVLDIPEDMDEEEAEILKGQTDKFNAKMKAQHDMLKSVMESSKALKETINRYEQEKNLQFVKAFDESVSGLGTDWEELVGKGSMNDLADDSAQANNRATIFKEVLALRNSHPEWDQKKLFETATAIAFPEESKRSTLSTAKKKVRDHATSRATTPPAKKRKASITNSREGARTSLVSSLKKLMGVGR